MLEGVSRRTTLVAFPQVVLRWCFNRVYRRGNYRHRPPNNQPSLLHRQKRPVNPLYLVSSRGERGRMGRDRREKIASKIERAYVYSGVLPPPLSSRAGAQTLTQARWISSGYYA